MEPLVASSALHVVRSGRTGGAHPGASGELAGLLRDGRVVAAEVLGRGPGGRLLLAIGRHQVAALGSGQLEPGARLFLRVQASGGKIALHSLGPALAPVQGEENPLLLALRGLVGRGGKPIGELLAELALRLRSELGARGGSQEVLQRLLGEIEAHLYRPGAGGEDLRAHLRRSGLFLEAALARRSGGHEGDLKAALLRALAGLSGGGLRESVERALAGLETEQLLNLARERSGDPLSIHLALPDEGGLGDARLLVPPRRDREDGDASGADDPEPAVVLELSFARTGPVRAELSVVEGTLHVRLAVTRADVAQRIVADSPRLAELLAELPYGAERKVRIFTRLADPEELRPDEPVDIRFLREHHLVNVSG